MTTIDCNVRLAAAGDMQAFEELYKTYRRRVFNLCLRMTRDQPAAEDLTQDVFVQLIRKLKTFRGEASFTTWLHRLTVNEVLMRFRKPAVRAERTTEDGTEPLRIVPGTENPARMSLVSRVSLNEAIRRLAPGYRTVFILHDVEGFEHHEISKMLGCAVGTSKSQLHRARTKLRDQLTKPTSPHPGYESQALPVNFALRQQMA